MLTWQVLARALRAPIFLSSLTGRCAPASDQINIIGDIYDIRIEKLCEKSPFREKSANNKKALVKEKIQR
jgi:hypothetical protein